MSQADRGVEAIRQAQVSRRLAQAASITFLAVGLAVVTESLDFTYLTPIGPGPGFFPIWCGGLLAGLSLVSLIQSSLESRPRLPERLPGPAGLLRVLAVVLGIAAFTLIFERAGFTIAGFLLSLFLMLVFDRRHPLVWLVASLVLSIGSYALFRHGFGMPLPASPLGFIRAIGV